MFAETPDADADLDLIVQRETSRPGWQDLKQPWLNIFDRMRRLRVPRIKNDHWFAMDIRAVLVGTAPGSPSPGGS